MKENQKMMFSEQWIREVKRRIENEAGMPVCALFERTGEYVTRKGWTLPIPASVKEWIKSNPRPEITEREFFIQLAYRVERLEAALAKKGGMQ